MDYIQKYSVSVQRIIGRLLTFPFRSRKLYIILCASFQPIKALHNRFLSWAQYVIFETRVQFQVMSMQWLLKRELGSYFKNKGDEFELGVFVQRSYQWCCHSIESEEPPVYVYSILESGTNGEKLFMDGIYDAVGNTANRFNILAPALKDENLKNEYLIKIRNIIAKYTLITKYDIIIQTA